MYSVLQVSPRISSQRMGGFDKLPVELIADILGELDLGSLIVVSYLSKRLLAIASEPSLNPWRTPIRRNLHATEDTSYDPHLKNLSVRRSVPRQNWVEILSIAKAHWLLYEATIPNLKATEWEECFKRRFLPGWQKWKKEGSWKEVFMKMLHRSEHRTHSSCTADEAWTKYVILNRNGSANELEASSRTFNPMQIFNEHKLQSNLAHLETHIRLVVEFADVRIIALGVLHKPRSSFILNRNARIFLHPPGVEKDESEREAEADEWQSARSSVGSDFSQTIAEPAPATRTYGDVRQVYRRLVHPLPTPVHCNYPFYTPSGEDKRWFGFGEDEEGGKQWVGGLMITAQLVGPRTKEPFTEGPRLQDLDLVNGPNRVQFASFNFNDLEAIAPWLELTKKIEGPGLGN
ncbi:hypothetical protein NLI96_g5852 [Meripilus lineatus]|uniref:F-box domain-containing protein n=1 Tax=Meripilus lineatus TaxID=2056292 RepID=A0AAD5YEG6_9APHY|nr:hypothetical protein NLI96_g5852 [Physisporinus lineatus]